MSRDVSIQQQQRNTSFKETICEDMKESEGVTSKPHVGVNRIKKTCVLPFTIPEIITSIGWILAITFCIWYVVNASGEFQDSQNNPTTSLSIVEKAPLELPAVTICNWNANYVCDFCNLTLKAATHVVEGNVVEFEIPYEYKEIDQNGLYRCYVFNNFSDRAMASNATGYGGVISLFFDVPSVPEERDARFGVSSIVFQAYPEFMKGLENL